MTLQVKETQHSLRDSESGLHRMAIGHHLGEYIIQSEQISLDSQKTKIKVKLQSQAKAEYHFQPPTNQWNS